MVKHKDFQKELNEPLSLSNTPHKFTEIIHTNKLTILFVHVVKTLELSIPFILQYHHIKPRLNTVF